MKYLFTVCAVLLLVSCGGGGGGGTTVVAPSDPKPPAIILDSFGRVVSAAEGFGSGDSGVDGTAADGAPIAAGTVTVTDARGNQATATTDAYGYFRIKVNGFTAPLVARVNKTNGPVRYSFSVKPITVNQFVTLNISGLTSKIASDVAIAGGKSGATQLTPQIVSANTAAIAPSINSITSSFSSVITKAGLGLAGFDPIGAPFVANHTGYDNVLDNTVVTVDATGATQLSVAATYTPPVASIPFTTPPSLTPMPGNWLEGSTPIEGAGVPTSPAAFNDFYWASYRAKVICNRGSYSKNGVTYPILRATATNVVTNATGYAFTCTQNYNVNGVDVQSTHTSNLSFSSYVGCGSCGIGSVVSYFVTGTYSGQSTTFNGIPAIVTPSPPSSGTTTYVRQN